MIMDFYFIYYNKFFYEHQILSNKFNRRFKMSDRESIHTTLSKEANSILEEYANKEDENTGEKIFGTKSKVLERALELLDQYYNPEKGTQHDIWVRAREELNMVLIGKTTYLSYITGGATLAQERNIAIDIIEWYKNEKIDSLTLGEILEAIKCIWLAANYFSKIEIDIGSKNTFQMTFYHDLHDDKYSEFWGKYFSELLKNTKNCEIEIFSRNMSLILNITPP